MHLVIRAMFLSVALLSIDVVDAATYQCADSSGRRLYQDTPCSPGQKPSVDEEASDTSLTTTKTPQVSAGGKLLEGRWEITNQKLVGIPLKPQGAPRITKQCIRAGWLREQAKLNKQMSGAFGDNSCKEVRSELTDTIWRASFRCESKEGLMKIEHEIVFSDKSMKGKADATGTVDGKEGREVHRLEGKWLEPC